MRISHYLRVAGFGAVLFGLLQVGEAWASGRPSLVVWMGCDSCKTAQTVRSQLDENLSTVIVKAHLGGNYRHIDILSGAETTSGDLLKQIQRRSLNSDVDVLILQRGEDQGGFTQRLLASLSAVKHLPRLRMVYLQSSSGLARAQAVWKFVGAHTVLAREGSLMESGFFLPRFLKLWSKGESLTFAASQAEAFAQRAVSRLSRFAVTEEAALGSGLSLVGVDLDIAGRTFPERKLDRAEGEESGSSQSSGGHEKSIYVHDGFEQLSVSLMGFLFPPITLNTSSVPSPQSLVDEGDLAWDYLANTFPALDSAPGGLGTLDDEIWMDGGVLRFFAEPLRGFGGGVLSGVLDRLVGLRLKRLDGKVRISLYVDQVMDIKLADKNQVKTGVPYGLHLPKAVRFNLSMKEGVMYLSGLDEGHDALRISIKIPVAPDAVSLRSARVDMSTGKVKLEAGVLGNHVAVVAYGEVTTRNLDRFDIWESIEKNLAFWNWPELDFLLQL